MNDSIKKMLRITEKDLMITEVSYETLQKKKTLVVDAVLSPTPRACRSCGSTVVDGNGKAIIVKNGKKETIVRFEQYNHMPLVMRLKKQRYTCKNCRTHWTAQSYFVQPRHSIANHVRYKIASLLTEKVSSSTKSVFAEKVRPQSWQRKRVRFNSKIVNFSLTFNI
ncbi:ISL3 family transposase [Enterococcus faecium]|nr:ISL3 family transposase [Enterococcus faecium]